MLQPPKDDAFTTASGHPGPWGPRDVHLHPYLFFTPLIALPNRSLTRSALNPVSVSTGETDMSDFIFIALGAGTLLVLAFYARALDRL